MACAGVGSTSIGAAPLDDDADGFGFWRVNADDLGTVVVTGGRAAALGDSSSEDSVRSTTRALGAGFAAVAAADAAWRGRDLSSNNDGNSGGW